jgi:hypothetical protein
MLLVECNLMWKFLYICAQELCTYAYTIDKDPGDEENTVS